MLRPFAEEHLAEAGELLAARHRAHRKAEPLLPERYEDAAAAAAEVEALWRGDQPSGVVALRDGRVAGYLLGVRRKDELWGANVWVETAGHAAEHPEDVRDLYGAAAEKWVAAGRTRHYAMVPASDRALVDAWFRLSFGAQHALGVIETPPVEWPPDVRRAEPRDIDALVELTPLLDDHQRRSPVFSMLASSDDPEELRDEILADMAKEEVGELVAERGGTVVACFENVPVEMSAVVHSGLARPEGAALLGWAATRPDVRGAGAGLALTQATFAWARERGHAVIVTDWRETNLLSSRFWPARGFRRTFLRLYRSIP